MGCTKTRVGLHYPTAEGLREDMEALKCLPVPLPGTGVSTVRLGYVQNTPRPSHIPLGAVAEFKITQGPNQVSREDGKRRVVVTANVRDRDLGSFMAEAKWCPLSASCARTGCGDRRRAAGRAHTPALGLMTALVASLGFVPMALATGTGAEVQRPLAIVVIGGILSSTALTLVVCRCSIGCSTATDPVLDLRGRRMGRAQAKPIIPQPTRPLLQLHPPHRHPPRPSPAGTPHTARTGETMSTASPSPTAYARA
jgi:hypothetical protein